MSSPDGPPQFRRVDWDEVDRSRSLVTPERAALVGGLLFVAALYWYDTSIAHVYLIGEWNVDPLDWALLVALVGLAAYGVVPTVRRRERVARVLGRLRSRPVTLAAGGYLSVVVLAGLLGPLLYQDPGLQFQYANHPPVGFATDVGVDECLGTVTGDVFDRTCHGTLAFPLGTNERGLPMSYLLLTGARVAVYVLAVTAAFVLPLATVVGVVAGLHGGLVDDLLMGYVDLQLCLPAMIVYLVANTYWHTSLFVLLVTFGLFSWGGIARLVRSEVLQRREAGHVRVARGFGAPWRYLARRHILPNVTSTLVPAVFQLLALLLLVEAGVAFLGFHDVSLYSWGATISGGLGGNAYRVWWMSTFPALALVAAMVSLKLLGDGLRDALDPRGER